MGKVGSARGPQAAGCGACGRSGAGRGRRIRLAEALEGARHLERRLGRLDPLVTVRSAAAGDRLPLVVAGEDAEEDRDAGLERDRGEAARALPATYSKCGVPPRTTAPSAITPSSGAARARDASISARGERQL